MKRITALGLSLLLAMSMAIVACSDDDEKKDTGIKKEEAGIDSTVDDKGPTSDQKLTPDTTASISTMGKGCKLPADCKNKDMVCMHWTNIFTYVNPSPQGICSKKCKKDNPDTPLVDEDDCPKGFKCAEFDFGSSKPTYCLQTCTVSKTTNPCDKSSGLTCHPTSTRWTGGTNNVCFHPACKVDKDCPVFISDATCTTDADCTKIKTGAFCESSSSKCAMAGNCTKSGLCGVHKQGKATAKVGDPCKSDADCPNNGSCMKEETGSSYIGVNNRNGYCSVPYCKYSKTLTDYACPTGSSCHQWYYGGLCFKNCTLTDAKTCRGYAKDKGGDYECYGWDNLSYSSSKKVTEKPVCMSAAYWKCTTFSKSKLDCSALGVAKTDTTKMSCRNRFTGAKKTNKYDPTGVCMDNTASGPFPKPDAGVPDATPPTPDSTVPTPDSTVPGPDAGAPQG